jgi:hypothetical protein
VFAKKHSSSGSCDGASDSSSSSSSTGTVCVKDVSTKTTNLPPIERQLPDGTCSAGYHLVSVPPNYTCVSDGEPMPKQTYNNTGGGGGTTTLPNPSSRIS